MSVIGVMQGRLSPPDAGKIQSFPWTTWRDEFPLAAECRLECIEWIVESDWRENPLFASTREIINLSASNGVRTVSVCADYFMERPLGRGSALEHEREIDVLRHLIDRCHAVGATYLTLPFVDNSAIRTANELDRVVEALSLCLDDAEQAHVIFALETDLAPNEFANLLAKLDHASVRVNYDIGNSASLGFETISEIQAYGRKIATVHVKDRVRGGSTVPLGTGSADFGTTFRWLNAVGYDGPLILQAARVPGVSEAQTIRSYMAFVRSELEAAFNEPLK